MGKKIYAQSNSSSEYVQCVYKWVRHTHTHTHTHTHQNAPHWCMQIDACRFSFVWCFLFFLVAHFHSPRMTDIITRRQRTPWFWPDLSYNMFGEGMEHNRRLKTLQSFTSSVSAIYTTAGADCYYKIEEEKIKRRSCIWHWATQRLITRNVIANSLRMAHMTGDLIMWVRQFSFEV